MDREGGQGWCSIIRYNQQYLRWIEKEERVSKDLIRLFETVFHFPAIISFFLFFFFFFAFRCAINYLNLVLREMA